jgi:phospholipid/cholesterol/gamma-HCH transport system ATP-binding protein
MPADAESPVLRFDRVSVSFDAVTALADVSFQAYEGESRVIMGATGSGKTVLLKTALGLQRPDSGTVYVFGKDISRMRERELFEIRSKIGMLFQESALFDSLNIEENVSYPLLNQLSIHCPPGDVLPRVEEALKFVELEGTLEKFPSELSGGMRRRAAIARAVVTQPPLLLYDSPTAGLDPITANTIVALIVKERDLNKTTTLIVTYRYPVQSGEWRFGAGGQPYRQPGRRRCATHPLHGSARRPSGLRRAADRAGGVHGSVYFEVREASGIEHGGAQQSPLVAVESWGGGVRRHGDPGGADLPVDREPRHLPAQRERAHVHGGWRGHDRKHPGAAEWHFGRRSPGDQAVGIQRPQPGRGV